MIRFLGNIPMKVYLACSGGVDSMAILDFLRNGKRDVTALYFNHGTEHSEFVENKLKAYCDSEGIPIIIGHKQRERSKDESLEEYWRNIRYDFLKSFEDEFVITAHHLNDAVETYLFGCFHGQPQFIFYRNENIYRPFLITPKIEFESWCERRGVPFWDDESNKDNRFSRNRIRNVIIPEVEKVNPGIEKVVKKKVIEHYTHHEHEKQEA